MTMGNGTADAGKRVLLGATRRPRRRRRRRLGLDSGRWQMNRSGARCGALGRRRGPHRPKRRRGRRRQRRRVTECAGGGEGGRRRRRRGTAGPGAWRGAKARRRGAGRQGRHHRRSVEAAVGVFAELAGQWELGEKERLAFGAPHPRPLGGDGLVAHSILRRAPRTRDDHGSTLHKGCRCRRAQRPSWLL